MSLTGGPTACDANAANRMREPAPSANAPDTFANNRRTAVPPGRNGFRPLNMLLARPSQNTLK